MLVFLYKAFGLILRGLDECADTFTGIDSVEDVEKGASSWIRGAGFDEPWEAVGPRKTYTSLRL